MSINAKSADATGYPSSDPPVAGVAERVEGERDETRGHDPEHVCAVGVMQDLGEGAVEADRGARPEVDRRLDQEDPDEPEDDHAGEMSDRSDPADPLLHPGPHLLGLGVLEELLGDASVALVESHPDHHGPGDPDDPGAAWPSEDSGRRLLRVAGAASARAHHDLHGDDAHRAVDEPARNGCDAVESAV